MKILRTFKNVVILFYSKLFGNAKIGLSMFCLLITTIIPRYNIIPIIPRYVDRHTYPHLPKTQTLEGRSGDDIYTINHQLPWGAPSYK